MPYTTSDDDFGTILFIAFIGFAALGFLLLWAEIQKKKQQEQQKQLQEYIKSLNEIVVKTQFLERNILSSLRSSKTSGNSIGRSIIGGAVAGPVGAVIGSGTGKRTTTYETEHKAETTFLVFFKDGTKEIDTVEDGSEMYKFYVSKIEANMDDEQGQS